MLNVECRLVPLVVIGIPIGFVFRWVYWSYINPPSRSGYGKGAPGFMTVRIMPYMLDEVVDVS